MNSRTDTMGRPEYRYVGLFMAVLDGNIVNVALPHMMAAFSTNTDRIRWVVESYAHLLCHLHSDDGMAARARRHQTHIPLRTSSFHYRIRALRHCMVR